MKSNVDTNLEGKMKTVAEPTYSISNQVLDNELNGILQKLNIKDQVNKCKIKVEEDVNQLGTMLSF